MTAKAMNINSYTYYGEATTTSGSAALATAKLPNFDTVDDLIFTNLSSDNIAIKTGTTTVTVAFPTVADTASNMTIVPPGAVYEIDKERSHTTFAVDSESINARYSIQYGVED